jgi:hypothetical protein
MSATRFKSLKEAFKGHGVPAEMVERFRDALDGGEQIVWVGRPDADDWLQKTQGFATAAPYLKLGGAGLGALAVIGGLLLILTDNAVAGGLLLIFGGLIAGILFFIGHVAIKYRGKLADETDSRPCYVVTTARVLIHCGTWHQDGDTFQTYGPDDLTKMKRYDSPHTEGVGDLVFFTSSTRAAGSTASGGRTNVTYTYGMFSVPDVKSVEKLLRKQFLG